MREIPNTSLLVSLFHSPYTSANMKVFDISRKEKPREVYSFEEIFGGNIEISGNLLNHLLMIILNFMNRISLAFFFK